GRDLLISPAQAPAVGGEMLGCHNIAADDAEALVPELPWCAPAPNLPLGVGRVPQVGHRRAATGARCWVGDGVVTEVGRPRRLPLLKLAPQIRVPPRQRRNSVAGQMAYRSGECATGDRH